MLFNSFVGWQFLLINPLNRIQITSETNKNDSFRFTWFCSLFVCPFDRHETTTRIKNKPFYSSIILVSICIRGSSFSVGAFYDFLFSVAMLHGLLICAPCHISISLSHFYFLLFSLSVIRLRYTFTVSVFMVWFRVSFLFVKNKSISLFLFAKIYMWKRWHFIAAIQLKRRSKKFAASIQRRTRGRGWHTTMKCLCFIFIHFRIHLLFDLIKQHFACSFV